jgi:hypothetical protein
MRFIFGNDTFIPVNNILQIDCSNDAEVHIRVVNPNTESGATDVVNSEYVIGTSSGKEVTLGKRLVEEINFGKLDTIDLILFNDFSQSVTFTETPT